MSAPQQQASNPDPSRRMRSEDRRQQTDRRREGLRREADRQHPELPPLDDGGDAQAEGQPGGIARRRGTTLNSRPVAHALNEHEIRFLLGDEGGNREYANAGKKLG